MAESDKDNDDDWLASLGDVNPEEMLKEARLGPSIEVRARTRRDGTAVIVDYDREAAFRAMMTIMTPS